MLWQKAVKSPCFRVILPHDLISLILKIHLQYLHMRYAYMCSSSQLYPNAPWYTAVSWGSFPLLPFWNRMYVCRHEVWSSEAAICISYYTPRSAIRSAISSSLIPTIAAARLAGLPDLKMPEPTNTPSAPSCIISAAAAGVKPTGLHSVWWKQPQHAVHGSLNRFIWTT